MTHLRKSFEMMRLHQLKLNPLKCAFGVQARNFLEYLVHQTVVEVDQNKAKVVKELKKFLGQVNYLRRFISNLTRKTKVFSHLIKLKEVEEFKWEEQHQTTFDGISKVTFLNPLF